MKRSIVWSCDKDIKEGNGVWYFIFVREFDFLVKKVQSRRQYLVWWMQSCHLHVKHFVSKCWDIMFSNSFMKILANSGPSPSTWTYILLLNVKGVPWVQSRSSFSRFFFGIFFIWFSTYTFRSIMLMVLYYLRKVFTTFNNYPIKVVDNIIKAERMQNVTKMNKKI